jgi:hypothetical protein
MRATIFTVLGIVIVTANSQVVFDEGKPPSKQRSPEMELLNWMTGRWNVDFTFRETADGKPVKGKGLAITQWSPNGQFLISDDWTLVGGMSPVPNAWVNTCSVTTWNPFKKEYRVSTVMADNTNTVVMTLEGKRATKRSEVRNGDHVTKCMETSERVTDTEVKVHNECTVDDGHEWTFIEGTARKISE